MDDGKDVQICDEKWCIHPENANIQLLDHDLWSVPSTSILSLSPHTAPNSRLRNIIEMHTSGQLPPIRAWPRKLVGASCPFQ